MDGARAVELEDVADQRLDEVGVQHHREGRRRGLRVGVVVMDGAGELARLAPFDGMNPFGDNVWHRYLWIVSLSWQPTHKRYPGESRGPPLHRVAPTMDPGFRRGDENSLMSAASRGCRRGA